MGFKDGNNQLETWGKADCNKVLSALFADFKAKPRRFFTEHDLHSHLYRLVEEELERKGALYVGSKDGFEVGLVHHEYPTPFRCDMGKKGFRLKSDTAMTAKSGLYKRGHYDLVVLNPEFVKAFDAVVVAGKNYKRFNEIKAGLTMSPLLWACEIVFGSHVENGLPKDWERLVYQDADKIKASLNHPIGKVQFAVHGSIAVFIGMQPNAREREVESNLSKYSQKSNLSIIIQTA